MSVSKGASCRRLRHKTGFSETKFYLVSILIPHREKKLLHKMKHAKNSRPLHSYIPSLTLPLTLQVIPWSLKTKDQEHSAVGKRKKRKKERKKKKKEKQKNKREIQNCVKKIQDKKKRKLQMKVRTSRQGQNYDS